MHRGYVKLWRCWHDSALWSNANVWRVWSHMLMSATHTAHTQTVGYQVVNLQPGQLVYGRKSAAERTGLSVAVIRRSVKTLVALGEISIAPHKSQHFSVVTIVHWLTYQEGKRMDDRLQVPLATSHAPESRPVLTDIRPEIPPSRTTNKKDKKDNHDEPGKKEREVNPRSRDEKCHTAHTSLHADRSRVLAVEDLDPEHPVGESEDLRIGGTELVSELWRDYTQSFSRHRGVLTKRQPSGRDIGALRNFLNTAGDDRTTAARMIDLFVKGFDDLRNLNDYAAKSSTPTLALADAFRDELYEAVVRESPFPAPSPKKGGSGSESTGVNRGRSNPNDYYE